MKSGATPHIVIGYKRTPFEQPSEMPEIWGVTAHASLWKSKSNECHFQRIKNMYVDIGELIFKSIYIWSKWLDVEQAKIHLATKKTKATCVYLKGALNYWDSEAVLTGLHFKYIENNSSQNELGWSQNSKMSHIERSCYFKRPSNL